MSSLKSNILLNGINTVTSILFPIITFPYAARVLLPAGIGVVNFQLSIINYIILLTSLGIPLYAVKEIAKHQDNKVLRDKTAIEILLLSLILSLIGYIIVTILVQYNSQIHQQALLFYILSLTIGFTALGANWFYQGIEDFKFITIRAITIRTLAAISLFIFVKDHNDLLQYGAITVGATVGNNIINFFHLRKLISWHTVKLKSLNIFRHLKPALHIFILNLIISLYVQLNSIMLGFMQGNQAVGYFTAGTKITYVGITLITSLGAVLLPRCSHLVQIGDRIGFASIINKSILITIALAYPMIAGLLILAEPLTLIFCGAEYIDAIPVLHWNAPVIILISLTNVMGIQILYPQNKVNIVIISTTVGALINLTLNLYLIPKYSATGAAIATLIAEFAVLMTQIALGRKYFPFDLSIIIKNHYIICTIAMSICIYTILHFCDTTTSQLIFGTVGGIIIYGIWLILFRDKLITKIIHTIIKR